MAKRLTPIGEIAHDLEFLIGGQKERNCNRTINDGYECTKNRLILLFRTKRRRADCANCIIELDCGLREITIVGQGKISASGFCVDENNDET